MPRSARILVIALLAGCALGASAAAAPTTHAPLPDEGLRVVDRAGVLDAAERTRIDGLFASLEQACGAQVRLLTLPDLGGEDVFTVAERQYDTWKLGRKGKDDGALILFARDDRKVRIHTGYGLEGALPDGWIGTLTRAVAEQYFRAGRTGPGLVHLAEQVVGRVADDAGVQLADAPRVAAPPPQPSAPSFGTIIIVLIIVIILSRIFRGGGGGGWGGGRGFVLGGLGGFGAGRSWGGGGGGGFGGGGGGGFGGSFGGGGRSGGGGGGASW